jgi:hypothetical protein
MAVAEIGNLATTLLNRLSVQDYSASANTPAAGNAPATNANALPVDRFTPSAQQNSDQTAAQQAGLFQIAQFSTLSAAANIISQTQPALPQAPQIAAPATTATTAISVQDKLQALNTALAALGLSKSDIQSLDRVASIVKDFNPVAYKNLVFQLQTLAQQAAPQAAINVGDTATATNGATSNGAAPANQTKAAAA